MALPSGDHFGVTASRVPGGTETANPKRLGVLRITWPPASICRGVAGRARSITNMPRQ